MSGRSGSTMIVASTPNPTLVSTNFAYCNPSDLDNFAVPGTSGLYFALVGDVFVLTMAAHDSMDKGKIGLNAIQRRHSRVSNGDAISVSRFDPPENFNLAMVTLELEFVKKANKEEHVDAVRLTQHIQERFVNQVMTTGQKVMLEYQGTNYIFTVNEAAIQEHNYNVVNETLRIANIIGGVFRQAMTDVDIKGYTIPKGWKVFASLRAVHLNPEYFTDARVFNPWRWQQSNSGEINTANVFTPFGGGPRRCPGYELARVELAVFLHHLVTRLSLTYKLHSSPNSPELLE